MVVLTFIWKLIQNLKVYITIINNGIKGRRSDGSQFLGLKRSVY